MSTGTNLGSGSIVVVEDDVVLGRSMAAVLERHGHTVTTVSSGRQLDELLTRETPGLILLDLHLPDENGLEILRRVKGGDEDIAVMVVTGDREVSTVVEAMKQGADHFLAKPFEHDTLIADVDRVLLRHRLRRQLVVRGERASTLARDEVLPDLVGRSAPIRRVRELVAQVAETDASVILLGESGTGKGMIARGIHKLSRRAAGAFVDINCASIQPSLLESEIFGYEKGAFTGASARKPGLMEVADGGTLFLDEVAEMDMQAQGKLLTALENRVFRRLGGVRDIHVDVRIVTATHHDLESEAATGKFRQDLFYRLNVFQVELPPLRQRLDDLAELAQHFVATLNAPLNRRVATISPEALALLSAYSWPGNVRELRNVIERAMILAPGSELLAKHLPDGLQRSRGKGAKHLKSLVQVEEEQIRSVLQAVSFNVQTAAKSLGISRSTLYLKMDQYGIERSSGDLS